MSNNETFYWKGKEIVNYGDIGEAVSGIKTEEEAGEFLKLYSEVSDYAAKNIGYVSGYYDSETMARIQRLFKAPHPIFGTKTEVSPSEALEAGMKKAKP